MNFLTILVRGTGEIPQVLYLSLNVKANQKQVVLQLVVRVSKKFHAQKHNDNSNVI